LLTRWCIVATTLLLAACSGSGIASHPPLRTMGGASALPGGGASALPGGGASALPGGGASALPGEELLACGTAVATGSADCTVVINSAIAAIGDITTPSNLLPGLHPADLQNAYSLPAQNAGGTVGIVVAYDDPVAESDLAIYRNAFGLPACTSANGCFEKVNEQGATGSYPAADLNWSVETSLDVDMVSAVCPQCKIVLIEANSNTLDDLGAAVDTVAKLGTAAINNSYYAAEWDGETTEDAHYNHPGIAVTVSAGDDAQPFYPATSPYVTSVGGTTLSGSSGSWSESPWAYTGQGCSAYETKPDWQGSNSCKGKRSEVDVAAVADPQTGVSVYDSTAGGWLVAGGTSVGAPLVAAAYALSGNPQGPAYLYAHKSAFDDIPPAGYDWPTGLGSPRGVGGF
jgi:subtilase family serine protease